MITDLLDVSSNSAYSISFDVSLTSGMNNSFFLWRMNDQSDFQPVSNANLFSGSVLLPGSPIRLLVVPAVICASKSKISGIGATIAFASRASQFYIVARDTYSNRLSSGGQVFSFHLWRNVTSDEVRGWENVSVTSNFNLLDLQNGNYSLEYYINETAETPFILDTSIPGNAGLHATYYIPATFTDKYNPRYICSNSLIWETIDFSSTEPNSFPFSLPSITPFRVRWHGFVKPQAAEVYTLYSSTLCIGDEIQVWIEGNTVVHLWQNFSGTEGSGTIDFITANAYYEIIVDYKQGFNTSCTGARLSWQSASNKKMVLQSSLLFQKWMLNGIPTAVHVHGLWTHVSVCSASIIGGAQITLNGYGFDENQNYSVSFTGNDSAWSIPVYPVTSNYLIAHSPPWNSDNDGLTSLFISADGRDLVELYSDPEAILLSGRVSFLLSILCHRQLFKTFCFNNCNLF